MDAAEEVEVERETRLKNLRARATSKVLQELQTLPRVYTRIVNYVIIIMGYRKKEVKSGHLRR